LFVCPSPTDQPSTNTTQQHKNQNQINKKVGYMANEAGKGTHRYALLVYQQPGWQKVEPPAARAGFQPKEWAKAKGWGDPVGGTYFRAAHGG
jgi:hypothetical protein